MRPDRLDREGRPRPSDKGAPVQTFRIVLGGPGPIEEVTVTVPREQLLANIDYYERAGRKWVVVKA
ncbi:MAG: hypothetical protein KGI38_12695 [Thaumarchaeota archaeon]|nr:hypothetical protein [Nitrososphaerota archaeon]